MKHSFKPMLMAATMLALMLTFNSCDDILGEWSRPTPNPVTPSGGGGTATVTSISIDPTLALKVGETGQLTATVDPAGTAVTWSSDQEAVATVDANGLVTAKADGTATITATAGDKKATCTVTVTEVYTAKDYKEGSWDGTKVVFTKKTAPSDPTVLTNLVTSWSGWYTVSGEVTITGDVMLGAETHLILQDGATLNCQTIDFSNTSGYTLYIYGQDKGDGKLNISYSSATALWGSHQGEIVIHGGEITAESTSGRGLNAKGIRVYGGKLTATSTGSDGIHFHAGNFEVYGGEVEGKTTCNNGDAIYSSSNTLKVYGGKVKATGGAGGQGFRCKVKSGTDNIKFYFSTDGTTWGPAGGLSFPNDGDPATNRYAKAE